MADRATQRAAPQGLWPEARSAIMLGMSYAPNVNPLALAEFGDRGRISVYAQGQDYHDIVKKALKALARWMVDQSPCALKVFVDTAPVMEKPLAGEAGLGWQGKHSNLVSRDHGSWLFLGAIYTTLDLPADPPAADACGSCSACHTACPTDAFIAPYRLDARQGEFAATRRYLPRRVDATVAVQAVMDEATPKPLSPKPDVLKGTKKLPTPSKNELASEPPIAPEMPPDPPVCPNGSSATTPPRTTKSPWASSLANGTHRPSKTSTSSMPIRTDLSPSRNAWPPSKKVTSKAPEAPAASQAPKDPRAQVPLPLVLPLVLLLVLPVHRAPALRYRRAPRSTTA